MSLLVKFEFYKTQTLKTLVRSQCAKAPFAQIEHKWKLKLLINMAYIKAHSDLNSTDQICVCLDYFPAKDSNCGSVSVQAGNIYVHL